MHCWKYAQIDPDMGITVGIHHPGSRYFQIESSRIFSGGFDTQLVGRERSPWSPKNKKQLHSLLHLIPTAWMIPHKLVITILKHMPRWIRTASSRGRHTHGQRSNSSWLNPLLACDFWCILYSPWTGLISAHIRIETSNDSAPAVASCQLPLMWSQVANPTSLEGLILGGTVF